MIVIGFWYKIKINRIDAMDYVIVISNWSSMSHIIISIILLQYCIQNCFKFISMWFKNVANSFDSDGQLHYTFWKRIEKLIYIICVSYFQSFWKLVLKIHFLILSFKICIGLKVDF